MAKWQRGHDITLGLCGLSISIFLFPLVGKLFLMTSDILIAFLGIILLIMLVLSLYLLELLALTRGTN